MKNSGNENVSAADAARELAASRAQALQEIADMSQNPIFDHVVEDLGRRRRRKLKKCAHLGSVTFWHRDAESGDWSNTCELYLTEHGKYFTGVGPPPESVDTPVATTVQATWRTPDDLAKWMAGQPSDPATDLPIGGAAE